MECNVGSIACEIARLTDAISPTWIDGLLAWVQVLALLVALATAISVLLIAKADRESDRQTARDDRNHDRETAREDREHDREMAREVRHHELVRTKLLFELDALARLAENLNRGGSTDAAERARMGAEALTLVGAVGPLRVPQLWSRKIGESDEDIRLILDDPAMPQWKKDAIEAQLALHAVAREIQLLIDGDAGPVAS